MPGGSATFAGSTINWSAGGQVVANAFVCKLDASRQIKIFCAGPAAQVHVIVDITGYYQ